MKCERTTCVPPGEIAADGYCDNCGRTTAANGRLSTAGTEPIARRRPTTSSRASRSASARGRVGGGLAPAPPVPALDPASVVLTDPSVPEEKRFCSGSDCGEPVGRRRGDEPGRTEGFCRKCGHPFSFTPKLAPGDVVGGQYAIVGCIAHGGLGWIYLALDRRVEDRWVVLKGLLNTSDDDAMAAALAERRFLAEVEHPNIVKIHNFVEHGQDGYIVMEYAGNTSLKDVLVRRRTDNGGAASPLPVTVAVEYVLEILPALGHLHRRGLLFCDFKPDNVMLTDQSLKLIDLGGVYRMDDEASPVWGTVGYQAPEIAQTGPTVASDLYTVGRTLAVLCTDFVGFQSTFKTSLPAPAAMPEYTAFDSLYRLIVRATAPAADDRFESAEALADQLEGVWREVKAVKDGTPVPGTSANFTGELRSALDAPEWRALPAPLVKIDDPSAAFLAAINTSDPDELMVLLDQAPEQSVEVALRRARLFIDDGRFDDAEHALQAVETPSPSNWRVAWVRGLAATARDDSATAREEFAFVYRALPGELAPKLALAAAAEQAAELDTAAHWYDIVARTDAGFSSAAFGLARCRSRLGDRANAIAALDRVGAASSAYVEARIATATLLLPDSPEVAPRLVDVCAAGTIIDSLPLDGLRHAELGTTVLEAALAAVRQGDVPAPGASVLGYAPTERDLRFGLETTYRARARHAPDAAGRIALIDQANRVRPRTLT